MTKAEMSKSVRSRFDIFSFESSNLFVIWLWYFNQTFNIFSQIGQIMLIGLVTKNGILIVEFANQRKKAGLSPTQAAVSASTARFRPILMTSLSTIIGILPIALGFGAGAESRVSMGIAVIGGLLFSGALTLYVIPAIYSYFARQERLTGTETVSDVEWETEELDQEKSWISTKSQASNHKQIQNP